jgi:hypothetical protein
VCSPARCSPAGASTGTSSTRSRCRPRGCGTTASTGASPPPGAVLWGAVDPDGRLWIYRELYDTQVGEKEQAQRVLAAEAEGEHVAGRRFADDSMWAVLGDAKPIAEVYAERACT